MLGIFVQAATPTPLSPPVRRLRLGGVGWVIVAVWQAETVNLWRSEDEGKNWSKWFSAPSRPVTPQVIFTDEAGHEALVGLESDLHRLLPDGRWQRHKLTSSEAPITALLPLADHTLAALTDRLVASTPTGEWRSVEAEVNGNPIAALAQSGEQVVVITSDGQVWTQ